MGKNKEKTKVEAVLHLLRKQSPLSLKQEKFCNTACVERFLKVKSENVRKAAKQLRACLTWRDAIGIENLIADEFSGELAEGVAFVAGHDDELRPVLVFRIKQDYQKFHSQKQITRLVVFTLEVAVQTMSKQVEQFVILFDASLFRSASSFMNLVLPTLKIVAEHYPGRLHKAFLIDPPSLFNYLWKGSCYLLTCESEANHNPIFNLVLPTLKIVAEHYPGRLHKAFLIDPPSLFNYLWKGVRPFVELSNLTIKVSSTDFQESVSLDYADFSLYPRAASLRFNPSSIPSHTSSAQIGPSASSRFTFTVAHSFDSLKPWYLSLGGEPSPSILGPTARSFSFASPIARMPRGSINDGDKLLRKNFIPSTPLPQKSHNADASYAKLPRTPNSSFLHTPGSVFFGRRESNSSNSNNPSCHVIGKTEKSKDAFLHYFKFYRRPYDEMVYRSKMKPPLGGLISIVAPNYLRTRRHMSVSQRF